MPQDSSLVFECCRVESESERPRRESPKIQQEPEWRVKGSDALLGGNMRNAKRYRRNPLKIV
eukprot:172689-Pyramimonas_sp.AAC.1